MEHPPKKLETWPLIRQAIVFQLKLGLDAVRDILLSPVSIVLTLLDILMANPAQQSYFIRLMQVGKKSDDWINLFAVDLPMDKPKVHDPEAQNNVDDWLIKVESVIKEQQVNGNLTQSGKEKLQQYFKHMRSPTGESDSKD